MNDKPILIVFEGADKTGKTTLINRLNKATDFRYVVLDRLTTSSKVYNKLFNRNYNEYYKNFESNLKDNFNVLIVLCESNTNIIEKRLKEHNEILPNELKDIEKVKLMFRKEVIENFENFIILDTTSKLIDECITIIMNKISMMEAENDS